MKKNRTALITGSTRGIGFGIALKLAAEKYNIVMCGTKPEADVIEKLDEVKKLGAEVIYCQCDISKASERTGMLLKIKKEFAQLNVLVNNAGVAPSVRADILEASEESFERLIKINLQGPYFLTQAVAKMMIEQKQAQTDFNGCIINVSSISAAVASPNRGDYCISKAGVSMATKLWAVRLGEYDIPVYEIRPGIIETDMTAGVKEKYDSLINNGLLLQKRWGQPDDVAKAVAMLANGDLLYSTGQVIFVDGGLTTERL